MPLIHLAVSVTPGDDLWKEIQYTVAHRLLEKCDAIIRIKVISKGADEDVKLAKKLGLKIYYNVNDIPNEE
ncbi:MAG: hypothetical protein ABI472_03395 [Ginsengibacter sp.]